MYIGQRIFWDFISETDTFREIWGKMLDRKPKQVSEKQWKRVTFWAHFCSKPPFGSLWDYCLWSDMGSRKEPFLMKKSENWCKNSHFLSYFCEILPTNLKSHIFTLFPHLISDIVPFMCKNHVFFVCFRAFHVYFGRLGLISDPGLELEGGL